MIPLSRDRDPAHHRFLKARIGVLITTTTCGNALGICDHAFIISDGNVLAQGTPSGSWTTPRYAACTWAVFPDVMKPGLHRVVQHLALTPQLQQSIRLLQRFSTRSCRGNRAMLDENLKTWAQREDAPRSSAWRSRRLMQATVGLNRFIPGLIAQSISSLEGKNDGIRPVPLMSLDWGGDGTTEIAADDGEWGGDAPARKLTAAAMVR